MIAEHSINHDFSLNGKRSSNFVEASSLARHRWYYYKEGFSPSLVNEAISRHGLNEKSKVLDPFNGSGTVTLTASQHGIMSTGIEVNPFTAFVAKTKSLNSKTTIFDNEFDRIYNLIAGPNKPSPLENYSTFSEGNGKKKWLFNIDILRAFNNGYSELINNNNNYSSLLKLAMISSILDVSNARKDGKCMRYKLSWEKKTYTKSDFLNTLVNKYIKIREDLNVESIKVKPEIICGDSRKIKSLVSGKYDLVITSPPYANTFDYTDIYRPELFLGGFINSSQELYDLRFNTIRSHIQVDWSKPDLNDIKSLILKHLFYELSSKQDILMNKKIPSMIVAYFEDMGLVFNSLLKKTKKNGHLWMVVSNSAYANIEIPVDLILADVACQNGWILEEIGVLRHIKKRKTKYSPDINSLRESVIILRKK